MDIVLFSNTPQDPRDVRIFELWRISQTVFFTFARLAGNQEIISTQSKCSSKHKIYYLAQHLRPISICIYICICMCQGYACLSWSLVGTLCLMECVSVKSLQSTCTLHIWRPTPIPKNIRKKYHDDGGDYVEDCRTDNCTHLEKSTELNEKKVTKFRHSFTGIYGFSWIYLTTSEFFYSPFFMVFFLYLFSFFVFVCWWQARDQRLQIKSCFQRFSTTPAASHILRGTELNWNCRNF